MNGFWELILDPLGSAEHTLWETLHWWTLLAAFKNIWHTVIHLNCMGNLPTLLFLDTDVQVHQVKHGFGHTTIWHNMASASDYQRINMCTFTVQLRSRCIHAWSLTLRIKWLLLSECLFQIVYYTIYKENNFLPHHKLLHCFALNYSCNTYMKW